MMPLSGSRTAAALWLAWSLLATTAWAEHSCTVPDELKSPATCDGQGGWVGLPTSLPPPYDSVAYAATRGYDFAGGCGRSAVWAFFATPHCRGGDRNGQACDPLCAQGIRDGVRTPAYCSGGCEQDASAPECKPEDDLRCDTDGGQNGECTPVHWVYQLPDTCAGLPASRCDDAISSLKVAREDGVSTVYARSKQGNVYALRDLDACIEAIYQPGGRENGIIAFKDTVPGCMTRLSYAGGPAHADLIGEDASSTTTAYVPDRQATMWALDASSTAQNDFDRVLWCFRTGDLAPANREFCGCPSSGSR